jgi:dihydroflavonol-4-reductase
MKAFITGGSGLIGVHLVRALLKDGYTVTCLLHDHTGVFDGLNVSLVVADITDPASLTPYLEGVDVVFHLAAIISLKDDDSYKLHKINVEGTKSIAAASQKAGVSKFIYFSSIHVYDYKHPNELLSENNPFVTKKTSPLPDQYTLSKLAAHEHILSLIEQGFNATILVPTGVIGPHPTSGLMNNVIKSASKRTFIFLLNGGFNWVDARDVAHAAVQAAKIGKNRAYLIAGNYCTLKEIVKTISDVTKRRIYSIALPPWIVKFLLPILPKSQEINSHSIHFLSHAPKNISTKAALDDLNYTFCSIKATVEAILTPK